MSFALAFFVSAYHRNQLSGYYLQLQRCALE